MMLVGAMGLLSGCSADLLDIDNPNEVTNTTYWNKPEDATAGVNACYSFLYKEGTWMRWLSFRYDLTSDEGWSSSPWIELGDWTRFLYNNYNFYEGNNIHWEHFYVGIFRCNQVLSHVLRKCELFTRNVKSLRAVEVQSHCRKSVSFFDRLDCLFRSFPV